jgi:hypothetical protein
LIYDFKAYFLAEINRVRELRKVSKEMREWFTVSWCPDTVVKRLISLAVPFFAKSQCTRLAAWSALV